MYDATKPMVVLRTLALIASVGAVPLETEWTKALDQEIASLQGRFKGRISVYAYDPSSDATYTHDVEKPSYIASGVKVPFMIEVFRQVDQGLLSWDEVLPYEESDIRDGAPKLNRYPRGKGIAVRDLVRIMVQYSDNAASDMLAKRVGLDNVNQGLAAEGLTGFNRLISLLDVRRGVFRELDVAADDMTNLDVRAVRWTWGWQKHVKRFEQIVGLPPGTYSSAQLHAAYARFYTTGVNHVRVDSLGMMMRKMNAGELVSKAASAEMLTIMRGAKTSTRRMLGLLPRGTRVAHKTGSQYERICDYGVIDLPDGQPLIFAACLADGDNRTLAEYTLARTARKAYDVAAAVHRR